MAEVQYVCEGSCNGVIGEDAFAQGSGVCTGESCERNGQPLAMKMFCPNCEVRFGETESHECD